MTLALDFDDEPESHGGWQMCEKCMQQRPISTLCREQIEGCLWWEYMPWVCKDTAACQQRQAERNTE